MVEVTRDYLAASEAKNALPKQNKIALPWRREVSLEFGGSICKEAGKLVFGGATVLLLHCKCHESSTYS